MALSLITALLLSIVNSGDLILDVYAHAPNRNSSITTNTSTGCQQLPITGVKASGSQDGNVPTNVLDNNLNTRWSNLGIGSWVQADLGSLMNICSVDIAWYKGNQRQNNFVISVSNDGTTFTNVFTGKSSGTTLSFETYILPGGTTGRFVRVTVNGNTVNNWASITELRVDGFSSPSPPTADNKNVQTTSGTPVQITLTGTDPLPGDVLKFSIVSLPRNGALAQGTSPNSVLYTPNNGFTGTDTFTYKSTDGQGVDSNVATVTITVNAPTPPTADNKKVQTSMNTPVQITLTGTDPIPGDVLKFSIVGNPQHGTLTSGSTGNTVTYTPNNGFTGTDSFTYKSTDGQGVDSNVATVTITVNAPPPTANNESIQTNSGTPVQITLTGTDPIPGDVLNFSIVGNPQHGTLTPGTVSSIVFYTPNTGFVGTDRFTYKATDGQGVDSNIATVTIIVGSSLYDNFEGGKYTLSDGQTSPNGKWLDNYNGFGSAGVQDDGTGTNNVFFETPAVSMSPSQTHSTLVTSTQKWGNFDLDIDVKTVRQLRQNSSPNPWEVAWVFFRQTDTFHYYAFLVKPNGIEFDKKDCNTCTDPVQGQQFLVTASSPTLKIGGWSHWKITAIGNHITISVDGNKVVDYVDQTMSQQLSSGAFAMYTEDANVNFDNVFVTPR